MSRRRGLLDLLCIATIAGSALLCVPSATTAAYPPSIDLGQVVPGSGVKGGGATIFPTVAQGDSVFFGGDAYHSPAGALAAVEQLTPAGWQVVTRSALDTHSHFKSFALVWHPGTRGPATLRVALRLHHGDLVVTAPQTTRVAQTRCTAPSLPAEIPAGDGWVTGGLYTAVNSYPDNIGVRIDPPRQPTGCDWLPYTITVAAYGGQAPRPIMAAQAVKANQSYAIALPPGRYGLESTYEGRRCRTDVTVIAGQQSWADTPCF